MLRRACVIAVVLAASASPAHAYEFWVRARSIGQAYQLRQYRLIGPDLFLGRRRYSETIALRIVDIGGLAAYRKQARLPEGGLRISWQSYLRVDHDFGTYTSAKITLSPAVRRDAIDAIPELADSSAGLDLLYGFVALEGLADDALTVKLGRLLVDDGWGSSGLDGASASYALPMLPIEISAQGGLRVRAASPLGISAYELDGTSGAGCQEYVEGPSSGIGTWKLIDRNRIISNSKLASDYELCPQREMRQPSIGVSIATSRLRNVGAEVGYRRTWSETVGVFDDPDRLMYTDRGLYPNDVGQAPASGVNEERLYARVHGALTAGPLLLRPYANLRYSLLHAAVDRADAGLRFEHGKHSLEPSVEYFLPTFDGDSIFNVFSIEPTTDVRLGYQFNGPIRMRASAWLRRYAHEDGTSSISGGGEAGVERALGRKLRARVDGLFDDGYGGRRAGGTGEVAWRARDDFWLRGRAAVLGVRPDDRSRFVTVSGVLSGTLRVSESVGFHVIGEVDHDDIYRLATRMIGVIDLAFTPEP
ncbi:MAG: hypothetical protein ABI175_18200 [Polyangiales bacterium]